MSFRLKMLGGAVLLADGSPVTGRATQRRRIALLALVGAAGERGVSRDRLMSLLWPESDAERGRHLLSDSVYRVNQALGGDAIVAVGDALALNPERVTTDYGEFTAAYENEEWSPAVAVYGGPLLDGFHVSDCAELERWIDAERDRAASRYARALEQLAAARESEGDALGALEAARALAIHDPLSARFAMRYMRALDRAGERAAAVRHARVYAAMVEQELGSAPEPEVESLAQRIAAGRPTVPAPAQPAARDAAPTAPESPGSGGGAGASAGTPDEPRIEATAASAPTTQPPSRSSPPRGDRFPIPDSRFPRRRLRRFAVLAVVLVVAAVGLVAWSLSRSGASRNEPRTIAVLPFADLNPAAGQAYLADGITEELIATLSRIPGLQVAARTSSFAFKGKPADIREVGARLGVETVLEGSVRSSGTALRITAQLVDVRDGYPFWSETYERELDDAFAIQDEIAREIVSRLRPAATAGDSAAPPRGEPVDAEAYDLYLKGRYAWHQRTQAGLMEAAVLLEQAVKRQPRYARGHAGLGEAYAVLGFYDYLPPADAFPRAAASARRAIELDSGLASPHATLGYVALYHDWDFARSEAEFRRAIAIDPGYSTAHQWYANLLTAMGRFPEAERTMRRAMELDPLSLIANAALGWVHYHAGEPRRAIEQLDRTLELDSAFELARFWKGQSHAVLQQHDSARVLLQAVVRSSGRSSLMLAGLSYVHAAAGDTTAARAVLAEIESRDGTRYIPSYDIARVYAELGDEAAALGWLERAARERSHSIAFLTVDPALAPLRGSPRFQALVALRSPGT